MDVKKHLIHLQGKDYLPVAARIVAFREAHATGVISTELVTMEPRIVVRASIHAADGVMLATGYGTAPVSGKGTWQSREIEKAETAAIGRALAHAGFGTLYAVDADDTDNLADSPVESPRKAEPPANGWTQQQYDDLLALADKAGMDRRDVPGLLGVNRVSEYSPGFKAAAEMVKAHGAAIHANGGAK